MAGNKIMKKIYLIFICLALASCEDRETARTRNEEKLPAGCKIIDLDYGELKAAVVCDGRKSTTQLREWQEIIMQTQIGPNNQIQFVPVTYYYSSLSATIE